MDTRQRSRRQHSRSDVSWTAWVKTSSQRLRCHTVDVSPNGAKLRPRGEIQPGTPVQLQLQPPEGRVVHVAGLVWRVDNDGMAVMFLKSIPVKIEGGRKLPENGRRGWR